MSWEVALSVQVTVMEAIENRIRISIGNAVSVSAPDSRNGFGGVA
jgi:hypothetical protein